MDKLKQKILDNEYFNLGYVPDIIGYSSTYFS